MGDSERVARVKVSWVGNSEKVRQIKWEGDFRKSSKGKANCRGVGFRKGGKSKADNIGGGFREGGIGKAVRTDGEFNRIRQIEWERVGRLQMVMQV